MNVQIYQGANNHFRIAAISGLLAGVAAGTASAGHLFAARWSPPAPTSPAIRHPRYALISRLRARLVTVTGPTAAQEIGIDASIVRAYSASHSGGTAIAIPTAANGNTNKKRSLGADNIQVAADSAMADLRIATTGALTNGTETFDSTPIGQAVATELATGAAVATNACELFLSTEDLSGHPNMLAPAEGVVIRNRIALGAAYTARLIVELDWCEVDRLP